MADSRIKIFFVFVAFFIVFSNSLKAAESERPCTDIRLADLRNATLTIGNKTFQFHNGRYTAYLSPEDSGIFGATTNHQVVEWEATIEEEIILYPAPTTPIRFLLIDDEHAIGSGSHNFMAGYSCLNGMIHQVFARDAVAIDLNKLNSYQVSIRVYPYYQSSKHTVEVYVWDKASSRYIRDVSHN